MSEQLKSELIEAIEAKMKKDDISQAEVARRIGALRTNVNLILRRKNPVTLDFLVKIAESIGMKVEMKFRDIKDWTVRYERWGLLVSRKDSRVMKACKDELKVQLVGLVDNRSDSEIQSARVQEIVNQMILLGRKRGRPRKEIKDEDKKSA